MIKAEVIALLNEVYKAIPPTNENRPLLYKLADCIADLGLETARSSTITVHLPRTDISRLKEIANMNALSVSALVASMIRVYISEEDCSVDRTEMRC